MHNNEGLRIIKERSPQTFIIMHTVLEDEERLFKCLCSGANGYILKNTSFVNLLDAIDNVLHGGALALTTYCQKKYCCPSR